MLAERRAAGLQCERPHHGMVPRLGRTAADATTDRGEWPSLIHDFYRSLFQDDVHPEHDQLWRLRKLQSQAKASRLD
eukprot:849998-Lingulodinium_polyedra.AAC.1